MYVMKKRMRFRYIFIFIFIFSLGCIDCSYWPKFSNHYFDIVHVEDKVLASIDIRLVVWKANEPLATWVRSFFIGKSCTCKLFFVRLYFQDENFKLCDNVCKVSTKTMWKSPSSSTCNQLLRNPITICIAGHSFISGNEVNEHAYRNRINNSPFRLRQ